MIDCLIDYWIDYWIDNLIDNLIDYWIDQLAASAGGGYGGGSMARKGVEKRLLQIVSVTTEVANSSRVSRFKLQLRDRPETRRWGGKRGGGVLDWCLS